MNSGPVFQTNVFKGNFFRPAPRWLKRLIFAMSIVVIPIVFLVLGKTSAEVEATASSAQSKSSVHSNSKTLDSHTNTHRAAKAKLKVFDGTIRDIQDRLAESKLRVSKLAKRFDESDSAVSRLNNAIASQARLLDSLRREVTALVAAARARKVARPKSGKGNVEKHYQPAFQLVSIDVWNETHQAVLRVRGKLVPLAESNEVQGWIVLRIEPDAQQAVLKNARGRTMILKLTG